MKYNIINQEEDRMAKLVNEIAFQWDPETTQVSQLPIQQISKLEICDEIKKERQKREQKYQSKSNSTYNPATDPYFNNPAVSSIAQIQHEAQQKYIGGIRGTLNATVGNELPNQHPLTVLPAPNVVTTPGVNAGTSINPNPFGFQLQQSITPVNNPLTVLSAPNVVTTPGVNAGTAINHNPFGLPLQLSTTPKNINGIHINHNPFAPTPTHDEL